jgi:hypothetical protein
MLQGHSGDHNPAKTLSPRIPMPLLRPDNQTTQPALRQKIWHLVFAGQLQ